MEADAYSVSVDLLAGSGDNGGVGDELQDPGEEGLRHRQPQVHRCPGLVLGSVCRCSSSLNSGFRLLMFPGLLFDCAGW
jgi:hypothetical protein